MRYWIADQHLPDDNDVGLVGQELFGANSLFDDAKAKLWRRLRQTRVRNAARRKAKKALHEVAAEPAEPADDTPTTAGSDGTGPTPVNQNLPALHRGDSGSAGSDMPNDDDIDAAYDAEQDTWYVPASWKPEKRETSGKLPEIPRVIVWPRAKARRIRRAPLLVAGIALLLGGYAWTRTPPVVSDDTSRNHFTETPDRKNKREAEARARANAEAESREAERIAKETADRQKTEDDARVAEEKRKAGEAQARLRAEQRFGISAAKDASEQKRMDDQANAQALNAKLKVWAQADGTLAPPDRPLVRTQADGNDLCKQKLEGVSVPDFTLKCDTLIPFGLLLNGVSVTQTATSLADCAARCRKVVSPTKCVAFSFDAGAHTGAASCYLTGSITSYNPATNWIAGTR